MMFAASLRAEAIWGPYINTYGSRYDGLVIGAYAIGSDGVSQIETHQVFALTGNGPAHLNAIGLETAEPEDETDPEKGGGGLQYLNGSVQVFADRVRVGLRYYYNKYRDSSMEAANLENSVGSGYAFGYLDSEERFVQYDESSWTDERQITMMPMGDGRIGVYITGTETLLYSVESTDKDHYLAVHPLCDNGDALTWFTGRKYYGDFAYADLGNGKITVVNCVPLEQYIQGVCAGERVFTD